MHQVETMAYAGQTPWHGLGQLLAPNQPMEVWKRDAGMAWEIRSADVRYSTDEASDEASQSFPGQKVLYRSDTQAPLAVVSKRFHIVQPGEVLEFYRDLTQSGGFALETAGVLREGRTFWALARTQQTVTLAGGDKVDGYLLLATACDGTLATTAQFTSVRVVCNNTLRIALGQRNGAIKVPHRSHFDADAIKRQLGLTIAPWDGFVARMKDLCQCTLGVEEVDALLRRVLVYPVANKRQLAVNEQAVATVRALYEGKGRGAELFSSRGTAWGLLNSVTEFLDHHRRARNEDYRRDAAWFGEGTAIKQRAWEEVSACLV